MMSARSAACCLWLRPNRTRLPVVSQHFAAARRDGAHLFVPQSKPVAGALAYLKLQSRDKLAERVGFHARALGRTPGKLTLRDTRSRWGSCTPSGDLMFSWRLIMAPTRILDYVAAHEVAHLAQMNHSAAFWAEVNRLFPAHLEARRWLKAEGGVKAMQQRNAAKADCIYSEIDRNPLFKGFAETGSRSVMNATFTAQDESHTPLFLEACAAAGINGIKGHRSVGGFRASMYNALPLSSVKVLAEVMQEFERTHG